MYPLPLPLLGPVGTGASHIELRAPTVTTSGTSIDVAGLAGAKRFTVMFNGVSTTGTSLPMMQLGPAAGPETTGYLGSGSSLGTGVNHSTGFRLDASHAATTILHGEVTFTLMDAATDTWVASGGLGMSDVAVTTVVRGTKPLAGPLTQVRLTTVGGTDTFDAGSISVLVET